MCEGKDKYVWLATCMCEVTVYKFRYSTFTLWLIYVCVCVWCGDTHAVRPCLVVSGRWRGRRASLCHCLSVSLLLDEESGSEMWSSEWNIKQPAAAGLSGHRPVRGWTTGLLCVCLCVSGCTHTLACVHFVSVSVCWRGLSFSFACLWHVLYERFLILSWSFIPMMPFNFVCAHMHKFACTQSVNPTCVCVTMIYPCHHHIAYVCSQTEANC